MFAYLGRSGKEDYRGRTTKKNDIPCSVGGAQAKKKKACTKEEIQKERERREEQTKKKKTASALQLMEESKGKTKDKGRRKTL